MKIYNKILFTILLCGFAGAVIARPPAGYKKPTPNKAQYRAFCASSESQIDQEINNVRVRLLGGGDCWWDFENGRYIVPKVEPGSGRLEVSSLYAGSVWLGGIDPSGSLKLACMDFRGGNNNEFWPGPLSEVGLTDEFTCKNWDRHFRVTGSEIRRHLDNLTRGVRDPAEIPRGVRGWPARGNPYFTDVWGFDLPFTQQALAGFFDADRDGNYDPLKGDYPSIEVRGCAQDRYPDEMIFWIYNDQGAGAPHGNTNGKPIQMEVQVQAFGYLSSDELNDMTFHRYKLINRATERIDSTFFAMWTDPDLGCATDDYIGCDREKGLMYVYNQDATDGQPGCNCPSTRGSTPTYCNNVPILGIDYFRGPLDTFGNELGMSSFMYYNNPDAGSSPAGTQDPSVDFEFYNYLTGTWRDNTPLTVGGSGYAPGAAGRTRTKYALPDPPKQSTGWSMCSANLPFGDRRTLQASGPFSLKPGAVNELIIGIPWVADVDYPCPDLEGLFRADKLAQGLFDNCFEPLSGPDAPKVDWVELDQQLIGVISNPTGNNIAERYSELDILAPDSLRKSTDPVKRAQVRYRFEGYLVYQLSEQNVSITDFTNPEKGRLAFQFDVKNNVKKLYNWEEQLDPGSGRKIYIPSLKADGKDSGIRHTFTVTEDLFALGNDKSLINHKKYYFAVVAYAFNSYSVFDPLATPAKGQQNPYLASKRSFDGEGIRIITVAPRPIVDQALQSAYGEGVPVTRLEGIGNGGNFLDLSEETRAAIFSGKFDSTLTYKPGRGPIKVTVFNPFEVKDGEYEIALVDGDLNDTRLEDTARWQLRRLPDGRVIASERSLAELNEQIVADFGFSVEISQVGEPGNLTPNLVAPQTFPISPGDANGAIGAEYEYADPNQPWLLGLADQEAGYFNYVKTNRLELDEDLDPKRGLSQLGNGWFVPYVLCDWRLEGATSADRLITPAWTGRMGAISFNLGAVGATNPTATTGRYRRLNNLPNVDIVLTKDTSKWSRCIVIESASEYYYAGAYSGIQDPRQQTESPTSRRRQHFDTRFSPSVGKIDANGDGLPDPDNARDASGNALTGLGWFPGYAIDVETGRRLNIFFGENSCYSRELNPAFTGRDMLFNPTGQFLRSGNPINQGPPPQPRELLLGGQHFVYVSTTEYDRCQELYNRLSPEGKGNPLQAKAPEIGRLAWAGLLATDPNYQMKSLREGLIPNDVRIKLRVNNAYQTWFNDQTRQRSGHPRYRFKIDGRQPKALDATQIASALDSIKTVPNPYYGFSQYETSQLSNTIKITNLPGKCQVTIYSLDGKFIRSYQRNEQYAPYRQITPDLEWDLKNNKGIPIASGVYLIRIKSDEGERTIKWFGVQRQFDPSGL